jgi:hypothetical protein
MPSIGLPFSPKRGQSPYLVPLPPIVKPVIQYTAQKRDIDEYTKKLLGGKDKWLN